MAVARRPMNHDLRIGAVEGKVRIGHPDRGGVVEGTQAMSLSSLHYDLYGVVPDETRADALYDPMQATDPTGEGIVPHSLRFHERSGTYG